MAQKKRKRKTKRKPRHEHEPYPGWMWLLFGLGIGLSVAFAIYMKDRQPAPPPPAVAQQPASMAAPMETGPAPVAASPEAPPEEEEPRFSFYSMLPSFEVVIPEEEADVSRDSELEAVQEPGSYVLQAGSFNDVTDADRRRAQIALLGVESRVQRVMIDDRTYHRVRVGPIDNLDELNRVRGQLRDAGIDVLRIRLGD
jgi:cell division protein FtsN